MKGAFLKILTVSVACLLGSCHNGVPDDSGSDLTQRVVVPVTVTHPARESMTQHLQLNAVSVFQKRSIIKSNVNGYIEKAPVDPGQQVHRGQTLFVLVTREARAIGKQDIDSTFRFSGTLTLKAFQDGFISQLDHQVGDYVMDGDPLCIISDRNSFAFLLDVPFELSAYVRTGAGCDITLPGGQHLAGRITSRIAVVDPATQTQRYVVKMTTPRQLPENLIVKVSIPRSVEKNAEVLPKTALLTNEDQTEWWVVKLINDSTAVKIPVRKGLESDSMVQILSPSFLATDRIVSTGNYGLGDTAFVKITP